MCPPTPGGVSYATPNPRGVPHVPPNPQNSPPHPPAQPARISGQLLASGTGQRHNLEGGDTTHGGSGTRRGLCPPNVCPPRRRAPLGRSVSGCRTSRTYLSSPNCCSVSPRASSSVSKERFLNLGGTHSLGRGRRWSPLLPGPGYSSRAKGGAHCPPLGTHRMKTVLPSPTSEGGGCRVPPSRLFWGAAPPERGRGWNEGQEHPQTQGSPPRNPPSAPQDPMEPPNPRAKPP